MQGLGPGLGGQGQHPRAAGLYLHHIADRLIQQRQIGSHSNHRRSLADQGDGAVLQLTGGIGLRVDVADLLQLQAPLQGQCVVQITADEEHILLLRQPFGGRADILRMGENLLHLPRQGLQPPYHSAVCLIIHGAQHIAEIQPQQVQHRHLGAVCLCGGHSDLRSGPGVEHVVALPGDGRAHHVHDGQHPGTALFGLAQGGHGVQRLAGLADDDDQIALAHQGVAVPELRRQADLHRPAQQPFQGVFAHHAHMVAGPAGHDTDAADITDLSVSHSQVAEHHTAVPDASGDGAAHRRRLLIDLLEHEVVVTALFRGVHIPVDVTVLLVDGPAALVVDTDTLRRDDSQLAVIHIYHVTGVPQQRRHIRGQEVLPPAAAQQQRRILSCGDDPVRRVGAQDTQRIGSLHPGEHLVHRLEHIAALAVIPGQQLGHHLRIRLGHERAALLDQLLLQPGEILDDPVVHHGELSIAADLRMGVHLIGLAVSSPPGVADAHCPRQIRPAVGQRLQRRKTPRRLAYLKGVSAADRDTGGVIAPVLQAAQSIQQQRRSLLLSNVSYDTTHISKILRSI